MSETIKFTPLFSGSSGNCVFVRAGKTCLLIDAGCAGSAILEGVCAIGECPGDLNAILITHEHSDHIKGAGILSRKLDIPIYANEETWSAMEEKLGCVKSKNICITGDGFYFGSVEIVPFKTPHDSAHSQGYRLFCKGRSVAVATDLGHFPQSVFTALKGTDLILLESNHDIEMLRLSSYPMKLKRRILSKHGHLSNESAAYASLELIKSGVRGIVLGHLSKENNTEELAYTTVLAHLEREGVMVGRDVALSIAFRDRLSGNFFV